ncbi:hypothetical protein GF337_07785 [candidate division KSB1 bacterium]|nr:hypothetical protein [candidate division KSB1 bacterium]
MKISNQSILLLVFISLLFIPLLHGQQIRMGPPIVELHTTPGSAKIFYLNLINQTDYEVNCSLHIKGMDVTEQGMPFPVDSSARNAAPFLKVHNDRNFLLKGKETIKIRCSFKPDLKTETGGYYGMILCRTSEPQKIRENKSKLQTRVQLRFQFACVVMAVVKGAHIQAKIEPEPPIIFAGNRGGKKKERNWYIKVPVRNDGNIHVVLDGDVQLLSETGQLVTRMGLVAGKGYLLPKQRRIFNATGRGPLPDGVYVANVKLGQPDIKKFATEKIPFYVLRGQVYAGSPDEKGTSSLTETSQGFIINKSNINAKIPPGGRQYQVVQLMNITPEPIDVTAVIMKWDQDIDGDIIFPKQSKHDRHLGNEVKITPEQFTIPPKRKKNVKLLFQLPKEADGDYFDAIVFQKVGTELTDNAPLLQIQSVLAAITARKTGNPAGEIVDFKITEIKNKGFLFKVTVNNSGNITNFPEGRISIFDADNNKIDETLTFGKDTFVIPENSVKYEVEWGRLLPPGKYRAELTYIFDQSQKSIQKIRTFSVK